MKVSIICILCHSVIGMADGYPNDLKSVIDDYVIGKDGKEHPVSYRICDSCAKDNLSYMEKNMDRIRA